MRANNIIFGRRRAYQRKLGVAEWRGIASAHSLVLRAKPDVVLPEFLPFFMQSDIFMDRARRISVGSLSPTINWRTLAKEEFALPSLEEQRRMLSVLLGCERQVESLRSASYCGDGVYLAVSDHFVADWTQRFPVLKLADALLSPPESGSSAPESAAATGHWVLALSALTREGYAQGQTKAVPRTEKMVSAELAPGDLLISRSNTFDRVGYVGIYTSEGKEPVSFPDTMMRLKPDLEIFDSTAFEVILQSTFFRRQIGSIAAGTSASMKKINKANLTRLLVPRPSKGAQEEALEARKAVTAGRNELQRRLRAALTLRANLVNEALHRN